MRPQSISSPLGVRSKIRPPTHGSNTISVPRSWDTVCSTGHHDEALAVHVANAWSGRQATTKATFNGAITVAGWWA